MEHRPDGERWFGFERARLVEDAGVEIAMVPLAGHTTGHTGFAVNTGDGWLLHAGDAYLRRLEIEQPSAPGFALRTYHRLNSMDETVRRANVARLAELVRDHAGEVDVFCSHDAGELARAA